MTDSSQAARTKGDSLPTGNLPIDNARRAPFNPIAIVVLATVLWGAAGTTLLWAGFSPGWALGLGYLASPVLTLGAILLADLRLRSPAAARQGVGDWHDRDDARTEAIAAWEADRAADRAARDAPHRAA